MKELLRLYRDAWRKAGHPGQGRVMLAFHMFCAETMEEAVRVARQPLNHYLKTLVAAAADWTEELNSKDYPNYDKLIGGLSKETFETQVEKGAAWVGTPETIAKQIRDYQQMVGGFEIASMQVNFSAIPFKDAKRSMHLFAHEVIPSAQPHV
jgi:alkanesulfonate monooxygenase SsuD/methylene tetrahydromethanopterin reductase-like flavin-dependent oxidoreductase (luciferase family)